MKYFRSVVLMIVANSFFSCSTDDSNNDGQTIVESFDFTYNNEALTVTDWEGLKGGNSFYVTGQASNGLLLEFLFNKQGNITMVRTSSSDSSFPTRSTQHYYSDDTFTFNVVALNDFNKTIEVNFSGKLYEDMYDTTSSFVNVAGSFLVKYSISTADADYSGLLLNAKINNVDWNSTKTYQEGSFSLDPNIRINFFNSDRNNIGIVINRDTAVETTYSFTSNSVSNKAIFSFYNTSIGDYEDYNSAGTLTITKRIVKTNHSIVSGTFILTATNPLDNSQIEVTNGSFKVVHSNF